MLSVFDIAFVGNASLKEKFNYLESCNHLQSFVCESSKSLENVINKVKSLFESPSSRTEGLMLLHTLLEQCSSEVFVDNALYWAQSAVKVLQGHDTCGNKHLSCNILVSILKHLSSFPDIWRLSATSLVPAILETLLKTSHEDEWIVAVIECLAQCMQHFPGACGQSKLQIEQFILLQLDNWHVRSVEPVATCMALLPGCGGGGSHGINYAASWHEQTDKLIATLHQILNTLFEGIEISDEEYLDAVGIEFPSQPEDPFGAILKQSQRFQVISLCVVKMLSTRFPVKVKVPTEAIISLMCRVLSVNTAILASRPSAEQAAVASVLPVIYSSVLRIMEALILVCQKILIPHSTLIIKLLVQVLKSTQVENVSIGFEKPFSMVHCSIYRVLQVWLTRLGLGSSVEMYADQLVYLFMADIKPEVNVWKHQSFRSSSTEISESNRGQKRKRKSPALTVSQHEMEMQKMNFAANHITCTEALKALKCSLYAAGCLIKPDVLKEVYDVIIHLILEVQQKHNPPIPYSKASCREELYGVLLAILLNSHSLHPPPVQFAVNLFRSGQRDQNVMVSKVCIEALATCDAIIHPRVSALQHVSVPKLLLSRSMKLPLFPPLDQHLNGEIISENAEWSMSHSNVKILNRSKPLCQIQTLVEKESPPPSEERITIPEVENNRPNVSDDVKHELSEEDHDAVVTFLPSHEENAVMDGSEGNEEEEEFVEDSKAEDDENVACLQITEEVPVIPNVCYDVPSSSKIEKSSVDVQNEETKENGLESAITDSLPELTEMEPSEIHSGIDDHLSQSPKTEHLTNNIENHSSFVETDDGNESPKKKVGEDKCSEESEEMNVEAMLQDLVPASPDHSDKS